ncbi:hypothetical protein JCM10212_000734 [Sporobolomyces blumeae]
MPNSLFGSDSEDGEQDAPSLLSPSANATRSPAPSSSQARGAATRRANRNPDEPLTDEIVVATDSPPPIPGLYVFPNAIPRALQDAVTEALSASVWPSTSNQVMLFDSPSHSALPPALQPLVDLLPAILAPLPLELQALLFDDPRPRQCILNLYHPGQGISSHVDLASRYADGIIGISLLSSTVMEFTPVTAARPDDNDRKSYAIRLKPGSVYVLSGPARYEYRHGIAYRTEDVVEDGAGEFMRTRRGTRISVTLRRMLQGAEVVGGPS